VLPQIDYSYSSGKSPIQEKQRGVFYEKQVKKENSRDRPPEGKPAAIILDIDPYKEMLERLIDHTKALAETPRPTGCHKITGSKVTGGSKLGITGFFMRSMKKK